jgi:hypothetical protein
MMEGKNKESKYNWQEPTYRKICGWQKQREKKHSIWKFLYSIFF